MVSARMLYENAKYFDQRAGLETVSPAETDGVTSLRSSLKGFYHNGCCLDDTWKYVDGRPLGELTIERAKEARNLALGAYYRLQPILLDYHSAINEVGAIYVSAEIHSGWETKAVAARGFRIAEGARGVGRHAFVIVGYDEDGFFILNSWGPRWGGFEHAPGIAHWPYADWADSIVDGWVLLLAVATPQAFVFGIGPQGLGAKPSTPTMLGSTARTELLGHYIHLDDGEFVAFGAYPSSLGSVERTVTHLLGSAAADVDERSSAACRHVLVWLGGGIDSTKDAVTDAVRLKAFWKANGVYPITVLWCSDFLGEVTKLLSAIFDAAHARIGKSGEALDHAIERDIRSVGRAAWRDVRAAAIRASAKGARGELDSGAMRASLVKLGALKEASWILHLVAEGAGAILAAELFSNDTPGSDESLVGAFSTLTLITPACTTVDLERLVEACCSPCAPTLAVLSPTKEAEARINVGLYGKSILELVDRAFVEEPQSGEVVGLSRTVQQLRRSQRLREVAEFQ